MVAQPGGRLHGRARREVQDLDGVEFAAASDMKRRMPLGFWLLVGVLHTVSSFSFVESVSCLCCARGGGSRSLMLLKSLQSSVPTMKSVNPCCVLGGGSRSRLCNQSASVVFSGEAIVIGCVCWGRFEGGRVRGKGRGRSRIRLDIGPIRSILGLACDQRVIIVIMHTRNHSASVPVCSGKAVGLLCGGSGRLPRSHGPAGPCLPQR